MRDPAFLFYPGDWLCDTLGMSKEEKGAYLDLWILQYNQEAFKLHQAKKVIGSNFDELWKVLKEKFIQDNDSFYNERLKYEIEKRKAFTESRRKNAKRIKEQKEEKGIMALVESKEKVTKEYTKVMKEETRQAPGRRLKVLKPVHIIEGVASIWNELGNELKQAYKKQLWNSMVMDVPWIESTCRLLKFEEKWFRKELAQFLKEQAVTGDIARGSKELKRHLLNKIKKQIKEN
jgi:uncharacterized protein YdaU (DUF1376 family)